MIKVEVSMATICSLSSSEEERERAGERAEQSRGRQTWKTKTKVTYHLVIKVGMVRFAIMLLQCRGQVRQRTEGGGRERRRGKERRGLTWKRERRMCEESSTTQLGKDIEFAISSKSIIHKS
jgi:hypothetical protein